LSIDLALLSQILTAFATLFSLIFVIYNLMRFNKKLEDYEGLADKASSVMDLFRYEEDPETKEAMVDPRLLKLIRIGASGIAESVKMSFMGVLSGPPRLSKGLKGAMAKDVIEEKMPLLELAGDFLGFNTKKYIAKNPDAMLQLVQMFAPMLKNMKMPGQQGNDGGQVPIMR